MVMLDKKEIINLKNDPKPGFFNQLNELIEKNQNLVIVKELANH